MEAQPAVVDPSLHSVVQRFVTQHTVSPASGCHFVSSGLSREDGGRGIPQ